MSMTPADPPGPGPRRSLRSRGEAPDTAWTTAREVQLECVGCGAPFVLSYKYRFVEGLSATVLLCPEPGCRQGREYYLPVNAFDVHVARAPRAAAPLTA